MACKKYLLWLKRRGWGIRRDERRGIPWMGWGCWQRRLPDNRLSPGKHASTWGLGQLREGISTNHYFTKKTDFLRSSSKYQVLQVTTSSGRGDSECSENTYEYEC